MLADWWVIRTKSIHSRPWPDLKSKQPEICDEVPPFPFPHALPSFVLPATPLYPCRLSPSNIVPLPSFPFLFFRHSPSQPFRCLPAVLLVAFAPSFPCLLSSYSFLPSGRFLRIECVKMSFGMFQVQKSKFIAPGFKPCLLIQ